MTASRIDSEILASQWIQDDQGRNRPRPSGDLLEIARAATGGRVILGISGKDSLAAWLYLREHGFEIIPYMFWTVPGGLSFERQSHRYYQDFFGCKISYLPHPNFVKMWNAGQFQPPYRARLVKSLRMPFYDYHEIEDAIAEKHGLDHNYLAAIGYRAADNPGRRRLINNMGALGGASRHYYYAVWDWVMADIMGIIRRYNAKLSQSYDLFGCTFDEYGAADLQVLYHQRREDYDLLKFWFPLIGLRYVRMAYVR